METQAAEDEGRGRHSEDDQQGEHGEWVSLFQAVRFNHIPCFAVNLPSQQGVQPCDGAWVPLQCMAMRELQGGDGAERQKGQAKNAMKLLMSNSVVEVGGRIASG